jgi:hypothetical protein
VIGCHELSSRPSHYRRLLFPFISGRRKALGMSSGTGLTAERGYALFQAPNRQRQKVREFDTDLI